MKEKILLIDDERDFAEVMQMRLKAHGYHVLVASNGSDGIRMAREERPALVLLDIMMPGMDGGDVAETMRRDAVLKEIPIVFLTALVGKGEEQRLDSSEAFVAKTAGAPHLVERVQEALVSREA